MHISALNVLQQLVRRFGRLTGVLVSALTMVVVGASAAYAGHFLGADSVDGREIRYEVYTQYTAPFGHSRSVWNNQGQVAIEPDSASTIADLEVRTGGTCSDDWDGRWTQRAGADLIQYNGCSFNTYDDHDRKAVASHEMGHALGIDDHELSTWNDILMYSCATCSGYHYPRPHDVSDYHDLWG